MKPERKTKAMKRDILKQIEELEAGIRYCIAQISCTTEQWVKKEYQAVIDSHNKEIAGLKVRLGILAQLGKQS
jgi:hypothetical protein